MDRELLEAVLGRTTADLTFTPGRLSGYVAERAARYTFPTLIERRSGRVDGIVTAGLTDADVARIAYFEDEDYATIVADIANGGRASRRPRLRGDVALGLERRAVALRDLARERQAAASRRHAQGDGGALRRDSHLRDRRGLAPRQSRDRGDACTRDAEA